MVDIETLEGSINQFFEHIPHVYAVGVAAKEQDSPQVRRIVDRVWGRFVSISDDDKCLGLQDLYCAILLVYK